MKSLFQRTKGNDRNYWVAIVIGIISGIMSALVKSGAEAILPPRTPMSVAPPIALLDEIGINTTKTIYTFSENMINWSGSLLHILFSIGVALIYCVLAEVFPKIKLWQGLAFGLLVAVLFHGLMLPLLGLSITVWALPGDEIISELISTLLWAWTIEVFRRDLRNRMTKERDPQAQ